jgi:DNA-binding transcriptional LysR family regulator
MSTVGETATWQLLGPDGTAYSFQHQPRYVADDRLVRVMSGWAPRPGIFHAVFLSRRGLLPAVRRFLDFLGEAIAREGLAQVPADISSLPQLLSII